MGWKIIRDKANDRKWELAYKGRVIATIYEKTETRYSLFVAAPMVYREVAPLLGKTWIFDTLDIAKEECDKKLREQVLPWCSAVVEYFDLPSTSADGEKKE